MPSSSTALESVLLHCSPDRTVWWRRGDRAGGDFVAKVFTTGSQSDAEAEFAIGRAAAGPGVVDHLDVGLDTESNRPCVTTRHLPGSTLEQLVALAGALPAARACELLAPVAHTLARLHALESRALPRGLCHADIKPQNLIATDRGTVLIDFEHARPIGTRRGERSFSGGTRAFAPPEAHTGEAPDAAFDVYGLGATLRWLLCGGEPGCALPQHPDVSALVTACLADDPRARPAAAAVAAELDRLAAQLTGDPAETVLHDWTTATFALAEGVPCDDIDPRARPWRRRRRLQLRLPGLLRTAALTPEPQQLARDLQHAARILRRYPRHREWLAARQAMLHSVAVVAERTAQRVQEWQRGEEFDGARRWLDDVRRLVEHAMTQPGGTLAMRTICGASALGRAPSSFLDRLEEQLGQQATDLAARLAEIDDAERVLDLPAAERHVDELAAVRGGTAPSVAGRRDQLHRLGFYLDRIARAEPNVTRVVPLWDEVALGPLVEFVADAARASEAVGRRDSGTGAVGLRSLQLTLSGLFDEFPHIDRAGAAGDALSQALSHFTELGWQKLAEAERCLASVPVAVRPLQLALGRLDTFRSAEAFVDLPERPRSRLLDRLEQLRIGFEQARSARDRLAEDAEHALARGHWTTGLFEMERAVAGLSVNDDQEQFEAARLHARLEQARRTKHEIEATVRRNVELAAEHRRLEDDPASTFDARIQVLEARRDCLIFLAHHVPSDRALLYGQDLRSVETQITLERAGENERRLDAAEDPIARLAIAREALENVAHAITASGDAHEPAGRLLRLIEHWRTLVEQCQRVVDADRLERERQQRRHRRRRLWTIAALVVLAVGSAAALTLRKGILGEPAMAGERQLRDSRGDGR